MLGLGVSFPNQVYARGALVPAIGGDLELSEPLDLLVPEHAELHVRDLLPEL